MEKGSVIGVEFTGTDLSNGKIFDSTRHELLQQEKLPHHTHDGEPLTVVVGNGELLPGLEKALLEMKEGEQKRIELQPGEAFGERKNDLVVVVPLQEFKKRDLQPFPGMQVELNNQSGKVQSVSGGRVRVDFNAEMAGKRVQYDLKVAKIMRSKEEKAIALAKKYFPFAEEKEIRLDWSGKTLGVSIPSRAPEERAILKPWCAKALLNSIPEIERVEFRESYDRKSVEGKTGAATD